jgi:hypothetical protein
MLRRLIRNWPRFVGVAFALGALWPHWKGSEIDRQWAEQVEEINQKWNANSELVHAETEVLEHTVSTRGQLKSAIALATLQAEKVKLRREEIETSRRLFAERGDCYLQFIFFWGVAINMLWFGPFVTRLVTGRSGRRACSLRSRGRNFASSGEPPHQDGGAAESVTSWSETEGLHGSEPESMLEDAHLTSERKLRLFAVACCRRVWEHLGPEGRLVVDVAERHAEGTATVEQLDEARAAAREAATRRGGALVRSVGDRSVDAGDCASEAATLYADSQIPSQETPSEQEQWYGAVSTESASQAELLRCVFGNPFQLVAFDADWRTTPVVAIANQMYETGDFTSAPVLADALMDAGCTSADVLDHLRHGGQHTRGCWVVDLVLGKG